MLSEQNLKKVEELKQRFPTTKPLTLPVLWMIQEQHGYISQEAMRYVAQLLNVTYGHVYGVVSFYSMYNDRPVGRYHLQVCTNISCMLRGAEKICDRVSRKLGIRVGETTTDKKFTLSEVECLGSCGTAPMMQINDDYYEDLNEERVDRILGMLK